MQSICKKCYGGNLISIHNLLFDNCISRWARRLNQAKVWIGVIIKLWVNEGKFPAIRRSFFSFSSWFNTVKSIHYLKNFFLFFYGCDGSLLLHSRLSLAAASRG